MAAPEDQREPVTRRNHETSWSANLEQPRHTDRDLLVEEAIDAVESTTSGCHVNLVTHEDHGHPSTYLFDALEEHLDGHSDGDDGESEQDRDWNWEYVDRCGCGGHVTRVHVG